MRTESKSFAENYQFDYQISGRYFAQVQRGLEELASKELEELGASECKSTYLGVYFNADKEALYKINYYSRIIIRVLAPLYSFTAHSEDILYKNIYNYNWDRIISVDSTFMVSTAVSKSKISHSHYAALRVKDGIADFFNKKYKHRPSVDKENPDIIINVNINNNKVKISFDTTGFPKYKRGYRSHTVPAPISETLAAAILKISGWDGKTKLIDPFCGSGTILAEGLMKNCNIPSGYYRKKFGFFSMPDFDEKIWQKIKSNVSIKGLKKDLIIGSDISKNAVTAARKNIDIFEDAKNVIIKRNDFRNLGSYENATIITNLPYGKRIGDSNEVEKIYKEFGDYLKHNCKGSTAYLLCGSNNLVKKIGLRTSRKIILYNGNIEVRLVELKLY